MALRARAASKKSLSSSSSALNAREGGGEQDARRGWEGRYAPGRKERPEALHGWGWPDEKENSGEGAVRPTRTDGEARGRAQPANADGWGWPDDDGRAAHAPPGDGTTATRAAGRRRRWPSRAPTR